MSHIGRKFHLRVNRRRSCAVMSMFLSLSLMLTGCTGTTGAGSQSVEVTGSETGDSTKVNVLSFSDTTLDAYVDSIDGNTLTLTLGSVSDGQSGQGGQPGEPPTGQDGDKQASGDDKGNGTPPADNADKSGKGSSDDSTSETNQNTSDVNETSTDETSTDETSTDETSTDESAASSVFTKGTTAAVLTIDDESVIYTGTGSDKKNASLSDIAKGAIIEIAIDKDSEITSITVLDASVSQSGAGGGQGSAPGGSGGGQSSAPTEYSAVNTYDSDDTSDNETIDSTGTDENAAYVTNGSSVTFSNDTIKRTSEDSAGGDSSSFYGVGAAVLADDGTAYVKDGTITTDSAGGAGAFAYDKGTVYIAGTKISTDKDTSGGIHVAGGGTLYAWDLDVTTQGESSAAIRSDRGGGTMVVDGGSYTSNGVGSPAVYCTADIAVNDADLTANGSEGVCIEGLNSLNLFDSDLTSNMSDDSQNDTTWSVIVYQSMSGDSEVGNGTFNMVGGSLTSKNGGLFYTTNTECHMLLDDVDIKSADDQEFFLRCTGNNNERGWGTSGSNGSDCTFTGIKQEMDGDVIWDSISNLNLYLTQGSTLDGAVTDDESCAGDGGDGKCEVYISDDSKWIVTGDSTVTDLYNAGTITDADGNKVSIVGTDGTKYVTGSSKYTITVSSYSDKADLSGADSAPDYSDYKVDMPSELQ